MDKRELAQLCRDRRIELGLTQQQLADLVKTEKTRISEFENNRRNLSCDKLLLLFKGLQLTVIKMLQTIFI